MQAILDSPSTVQQSRYAYSAPVRIIGLVAMILGVLIAAGIAGAVMLVGIPLGMLAGILAQISTGAFITVCVTALMWPVGVAGGEG